MSVKDQAKRAGEKARATAEKAKDKASHAASEAKARANQAANEVREGASRAYESSRASAVRAYDRTRQGASRGAQRTGEGIENNPLVALGGGLVLGLILGAMIPRSRREKDLLRGVGTTINQRAHTAFDAAREAGQRELEQRGLTADAAENAVRDIARGVGDAARTSAEAGVKAVRHKDA
ncbi:hypothetical protein [Sphingomicrobium astaxanthinifaciens]|uniref:hypothetical protein n=1 Tax=Sphingomicrobium astaxanthinifaciens TaxID=1227949 RepID=UPI001FCB6DE0|nr:hypothetical protein [Sphingomicrobium astaxanthinifaciens]MCJ7422330.1 hypothetical protein [Sphingomicrobium astaxanthinifaciens]